MRLIASRLAPNRLSASERDCKGVMVNRRLTSPACYWRKNSRDSRGRIRVRMWFMFCSPVTCEDNFMQNKAWLSQKRIDLCKLATAACVSVCAFVFNAAPALADDNWRELHAEVLAGKIKPLREILENLEGDWQGQVIDVDIEFERGLRIYEIEMLGPLGQVVVFEIDATTGELLKIEGSNIDEMRIR